MGFLEELLCQGNDFVRTFTTCVEGVNNMSARLHFFAEDNMLLD